MVFDGSSCFRMTTSTTTLKEPQFNIFKAITMKFAAATTLAFAASASAFAPAPVANVSSVVLSKRNKFAE